MLGADYRERISAGELKNIHATVPGAFENGDFQFVARHGAEHPELQGAAYILIGNPLRGLAIFRRHAIDTPQSRLFSGFAHFYLGDSRAALSFLKDSPGARHPAAAALAEMIGKESLRVLVMTSRPQLAAAMRKAPNCHVTQIGLPGQDCDLALSEDLQLGHSSEGRRAIAEADLFFMFDLGLPLPRDLLERGPPAFAYVPDLEMHLANDASALRNFDAVLSPCSQVHLEIQALYGQTSFASPIFAGLSGLHDPAPVEPSRRLAPAQDRPIDILFTGSIATPLYVEKPQRFFRLSQFPGMADIRLFDRTFPIEQYKALLVQAKFTAVSIRLLDALPTRAVQALRAGSFVLCNENTALDLYFQNLNEGVFPYPENDPEPAVRSYLRDYERNFESFSARRPQLTQQVDTLFPASPYMEECWFKLLYFLSIWHPSKRVRRPKPAALAVTWFNGRVLPPAMIGSKALSADGTGEDGKIKEAVTEAWRLSQSKNAEGLRQHGRTLGRDRPGDSLTTDLLGAFCFALAGDEETATESLKDIWERRDGYGPASSAGLIYFDFWLSNRLRGDFLSEALLAEAVILEALRSRHGAGAFARPAGRPQDLLLSGVGAWLAGDALRRGALPDSRAFGTAALDLAPENWAARSRLALTLLHLSAGQADSGEAQRGARLWEEAVADWPWYMPELFPLLHAHPDLDVLVHRGQAHLVFLRFFQRVRTDRRHCTTTMLPEDAHAYLCRKARLHDAASPEEVAARLAEAGLCFSEAEFFRPNVVLPLTRHLAGAGSSDTRGAAS